MQHCSLNNEATAISMLFPFLSSSQVSGVCLYCYLWWAKSQRKENIQEWTTQRSLCFPKQTHIFIIFLALREEPICPPPRNLPPFSPLPPPCLPWAKRRSGLHGRVNTSVIYWCCLAGALGNVVQTRFTNTYQLLPCGAANVLKCKVEFFFLLKASTNVLISYSEKSIHPQHECRLFIIWWFFLLLPLKVVWGGCVCVCLPAWGLCNWHSSPHVVILSHWLSLLSKWGAVNYLLTAALFTMQLYPPRPQNRSQHDTSG